MKNRVQKRFITLEIITKGDMPIVIDEFVQDAIASGVYDTVASTLNLDYKNAEGANSRHEFVGISIKEIK